MESTMAWAVFSRLEDGFNCTTIHKFGFRCQVSGVRKVDATAYPEH
jgi:hypothetical protein